MVLKPVACKITNATQTGGLLSDVFLHLVPHAFMGEHSGPGVHFVMVEEKRNIIIGWVLLLLHLRNELYADTLMQPGHICGLRIVLHHGEDSPCSGW